MPVQIKKGAALALLDLTPMIDMVFNLLIFFMVVSHFASEERSLKVELPDASEAMPLTAKPKEIFINIDAEGRYFIGSRNLTELELEQYLVAAARNNPLSQTAVVRADKRVPWDAVATAFNLCNKAGIRDYTAATSEE